MFVFYLVPVTATCCTIGHNSIAISYFAEIAKRRGEGGEEDTIITMLALSLSCELLVAKLVHARFTFRVQCSASACVIHSFTSKIVLSIGL